MSKHSWNAKDVELQIRRIDLSYGERQLTRSDYDLYRDLLLYGYFLLQDLLPNCTRSIREYRGFLGSPEIDIKTFAQSLKYMDQLLKQSFERIRLGDHWDVLRFKHEVRKAGYNYGWMKPVESSLHEFLINQDPQAFRVLNTWVNFLSKVNFPSLKLTDEMEADYKAFESSMSEWVYDSQDVHDMKIIMQEWLSDYKVGDSYAPNHGPGTVAGLKKVTSPLVKHVFHEVDHRLRFFLNRDVPYDWHDDFPLPLTDKIRIGRVSELQCVPKTILKNRTISREPISLMYVQQGIRNSLDIYIHAHPFLKRVIDLHKSDLSKDKARKASLKGEFATIDLSNASDSVSYALVKRVLRGTSLYRAVICTRSDKTRLSDGSVIELAKFAPMGSALCFPIECLVFAAVCEVSCRRLGRNLYYRVYGDDIICHEDLVPNVLALLDALHFTVNKDKSFHGRADFNFRESCGGEYVNGVDVTPFKVSRGLKAYDQVSDKTITSSKIVSSYVSFANRAFDAGLLLTRRAILHVLATRFAKFRSLMFGVDQSHLNTFEDGLTNWKLEHRFIVSSPSVLPRTVKSITSDGSKLFSTFGHPSLQRSEVKGLVFTSSVDDELSTSLCTTYPTYAELSEELRLFMYWKSRRSSSVAKPDLLGFTYALEPVDFRPSKEKILRKWIYLK